MQSSPHHGCNGRGGSPWGLMDDHKCNGQTKYQRMG
jgi:hypothetical protein